MSGCDSSGLPLDLTLKSDLSDPAKIRLLFCFTTGKRIVLSTSTSERSNIFFYARCRKDKAKYYHCWSLTLCTLFLNLTLLLKETYYAHFQLFWITARIGGHALMLKNAHSLILCCPVLKQTGYTSHLWLVSSHTPEPALLTTTGWLH